MKKERISVPFLILTVLFCTCLIASNLLETKILQFGNFSLTGGFIVFPISYIINDCIAEVWGFRRTRLIIWLGFSMNFFIAIMGQIAVFLPAAPYWMENEPHFNFVFSLAPRIALASFFAFLVGSFLNAIVISKMKVASKGKHFSLRAILSTIIGESADSIIFFPLAFWGMMAVPDLVKLMVLQVIAKTVYEIIVLPVTIRVVKYIKRIEGTDVYDNDISYNIF